MKRRFTIDQVVIAMQWGMGHLWKGETRPGMDEAIAGMVQALRAYAPWHVVLRERIRARAFRRKVRRSVNMSGRAWRRVCGGF